MYACMHERGCLLFACACACACKVIPLGVHISCMAYLPRLSALPVAAIHRSSSCLVFRGLISIGIGRAVALIGGMTIGRRAE